MKTTPEGLTHLVNMLVDVVNLQRKAQGTPGAVCEVELDLQAGACIVRVMADVDLQADTPKATLSADNNPLTMDEMVSAQREAIARARACDGEPATG
jgi:hypothetical protein